MKLNEINLSRSNDWFDSASSAFKRGQTGASLNPEIDELVNNLDPATINHLILVLQQQLANEPVDQDLEVANKFGAVADKFTSGTNKLTAGMKSINNLFSGNKSKSSDNNKMFKTKEFKQLVWKLEHKKPIIPSDYRLVDSIYRTIPDTQYYRRIKPVMKKLKDQEDLTDNEIEILKNISEEPSDDNDY